MELNNNTEGSGFVPSKEQKLSEIDEGEFFVNSHRKVRTLTEKQQINLLQYFEDQTLHIQRRFVSRLSPPNGYATISELIFDLNKLIGVIWYSIVSSEPGDESNVLSIVIEETSQLKLFGQTSHLLTISDNLIDYIEGFIHELDPEKILETILKLDKIFCNLLDSEALTRTEIVRLESIAERTRIAVALAFENITGYETEIGEVYENVLNRIT
ncbi:uncharacterized protein SAPINGB_P001760 [Magnusiomyces paraingens]|uniref:Uncharacterized protein n=1 Tax=Magnusiomyces paraingens TaxID=2606893 RepID=A0A5E8BI38_9ASCO|nr:uncharacterized protein SAPINGB_P001760 [Saprochaete ingens]VVT48400.1 unnamed protein product [Saprochaete ingens]